jgi:hypothetical protein
MVGASGFEPEASCAQGRRATRLRYAPTECCVTILKESHEYCYFKGRMICGCSWPGILGMRSEPEWERIWACRAILVSVE